jgi:hypothetical protein
MTERRTIMHSRSTLKIAARESPLWLIGDVYSFGAYGKRRPDRRCLSAKHGQLRRRCAKLALAVFTSASLFASTALGQDIPPGEATNPPVGASSASAPAGPSTKVAVEKEDPVAPLDTPEIKAKRQQLILSKLDREMEKLRETRDELWWYNVFGRFMFVIVHVILGIGLWMATMEFANARRLRTATGGKSGGGHGDDNPAPQELKIGLEGIAFKSSLQGTIILGLAFGFYFLYLKLVYPIVLIP